MAVALTITYNGYDYGFDFEDERIDVDAALDTISVLDLYEAIKDAQDDPIGVAYPKVADAEGRTQISATSYTYLTVTLLRNWALNSLKASGTVLIIDGNLTKGSAGGLVIRENPLITYYNQTSQAGVLVESGVSGLTAEESAQLMNTLTEVRAQQLLFERSNTVVAGLITQYLAGGDVTVDVAYNGDDVPTSETIA